MGARGPSQSVTRFTKPAKGHRPPGRRVSDDESSPFASIDTGQAAAPAQAPAAAPVSAAAPAGSLDPFGHTSSAAAPAPAPAAAPAGSFDPFGSTASAPAQAGSFDPFATSVAYPEPDPIASSVNLGNLEGVIRPYTTLSRQENFRTENQALQSFATSLRNFQRLRGKSLAKGDRDQIDRVIAIATEQATVDNPNLTAKALAQSLQGDIEHNRNTPRQPAPMLNPKEVSERERRLGWASIVVALALTVVVGWLSINSFQHEFEAVTHLVSNASSDAEGAFEGKGLLATVIGLSLSGVLLITLTVLLKVWNEEALNNDATTFLGAAFPNLYAEKNLDDTNTYRLRGIQSGVRLFLFLTPLLVLSVLVLGLGASLMFTAENGMKEVDERSVDESDTDKWKKAKEALESIKNRGNTIAWIFGISSAAILVTVFGVITQRGRAAAKIHKEISDHRSAGHVDLFSRTV